MMRSPGRLPWLILPCALAAAILTHPPAQAAGPLVLLAKQVVKRMLTDFLEDRIADGIRASFGPCKQDLANDAIDRTRAVKSLLNPGGPSALAAAGSLGGTTQALQAAQPARGVGGVPGDNAAQLTARMHDLIRGGTPGLASGQLPAGADMQGAMAQMQSMMNAPALTPLEKVELAQMLERVGKVAEAVEPGTPACSAADYERLFLRLTVTGADPRVGGMVAAMTGGMLRMFHTSLKQMTQGSAETQALFAKMSPEDRTEYVDTMALELKQGPPQAMRAFVAMLDADLIAAPADMREALKARLAP